MSKTIQSPSPSESVWFQLDQHRITMPLRDAGIKPLHGSGHGIRNQQVNGVWGTTLTSQTPAYLNALIDVVIAANPDAKAERL